MSQITYYRVRCVTDDQHEFVWADTEPSACPVNPAHTIDPVQTAGLRLRPTVPIAVDAPFEAVEPGASNVLANDRPAVEIQNGVDGFGAAQTTWPCESNPAANMTVEVSFIIKAAGAGLTARLMAKAKAEGVGEDSSEPFTVSGALDVPVTHSVLGEVFRGLIELDASTFGKGDAIAIHVGREGSHINDDLDQPIQIIGRRIEAN